MDGFLLICLSFVFGGNIYFLITNFVVTDCDHLFIYLFIHIHSIFSSFIWNRSVYILQATIGIVCRYFLLEFLFILFFFYWHEESIVISPGYIFVHRIIKTKRRVTQSEKNRNHFGNPTGRCTEAPGRQVAYPVMLGGICPPDRSKKVTYSISSRLKISSSVAWSEHCCIMNLW